MRSLANFLSPKASKAPITTTTFRSADTTPQNVKYKFSAFGTYTFRKDEIYNIDVLCTNCQEMINVNEIGTKQ